MSENKSDMEPLELAFESRALELAYERTCHQVETAYDTERRRQLRVRTILLEEDNNNLYSQLTQNNDRIIGLERCNEQLQEDLEVYGGKLETALGDLRIKSREVETLKAEHNSLQAVTLDSSKLLTEKLTLSRELSTLKSEVHHLRCQATVNQSLLAEKLSLQRQLSTLQVELETEKRATQRALARKGKLQAEGTKIEPRLEKLQADLAKERHERQRIEREAQKASIESENRTTSLESRLDAFKNKLKSSKEQLKETQASLHIAQASNQGRASHVFASVNSTTSLTGIPCKRAAAQMDADTMIGTPGDIPAAKKSKLGSTLIGEKSTFSITPFLNRTASVAPRKSPSNNAGGDDGELCNEPDRPSRRATQKVALSRAITDLVDSSDAMSNTAEARNPSILGSAKTDKVNSRAHHARKTKSRPILEQVSEENLENAGSTTNMSEIATTKDISSEAFNDGLEMKRRKRQLLGGGLGMTLFDEDEGDGLKAERGLLGEVRGFGTLGKGGLAAPESGPRRVFGPSVGTFGAISPLKKDRKGAR